MGGGGVREAIEVGLIRTFLHNFFETLIQSVPCFLFQRYVQFGTDAQPSDDFDWRLKR